MAETVLQLYLNAQHIKTSEQENITNLKKVVAEVKKKLEKKRPLIISYTLVALDPNIDSNDPVIQDVEKIIINKWPAFKNSVTATKDKSTTYVRSVILESLSQMAGKDDTIAAIIWHTSRDVVSFYSIGGETDIIKPFLQSLANQVEEAGRGLWGVANKVAVEQFNGGNINIDIPSAAKVDEENLSDQLKAALVYSGWSSQAGGGENPRHQGQQDWQWSKFAAERAAKGIAEEMNSVLSRQNKSLSTISAGIKKGLDDYFSALQPFLVQVSSTYANNIIANNKRSELLWWKQTLCSQRLGQSYRGLSILETVILMAIDLADQVDPIYPISVDYLLRETLKDVHGEEVYANRPLSEWIDESSKLSELFKELLKPFGNEKEGRKSLLTEMSDVILVGEAKSFFKSTGIDDKASVSASSLAVWLFHELQANKIAVSK
jgi:hypothetical protein